MKYLFAILLSALLASCSVKIETGQIAKMPKGSTKEQTQQFVQKIVTPDLIKKIHAEFPNISKQSKGRYDFNPVILTGQNGELYEFGILVKITGLEGWERRDEFEQFLVSYLKEEINNNSHKRGQSRNLVIKL